MRSVLGVSVLISLLVPAAAFGQSAQVPSFEVVSVRPAAPSQARGGRASASGDRVSYVNTTLNNVLVRAYQVKGYQIDGPSWIFTERYDIVAKAPDNTPKDQIPLMLQTLLADRFRLKLHRETRELPIYALLFVKESPKLEKVEGGGIGVDLSDNGQRLFRRTSMPQLADFIRPMVGRPVFDRTGLDGAYNFPLELSMEEMGGINAAANATQRPSIFTSVQELGLKLESRKAPVEMIVVDGGMKTPSEN
jgi:uncharacterized protein (TIGR03435 family)